MLRLYLAMGLIFINWLNRGTLKGLKSKLTVNRRAIMKMKAIISGLIVTIATTGLMGCSVMSGDRSAQTYTNDAATTAKVKANIARNDMVPASQVSVTTDKGIVQLSGFVRTKAQSDEAEKIALNTPGVKSVKNDIITYKEAHGKSLKDKTKRKLTYSKK